MPPLSLRHGGNADAAMNQQQQQQQNSYTSDPYEPTAERDTHNATRDRWSSRSSAPGHPDFHHHPTPSLSVSSFIRRDDAHLSNRPQDRSIHPSPSPSAPIALARIQSTPSTHTFSNQAAPSRSSDQAYQHPRPIATAKRRALPDSATDSSSNKRRAQGDGGKTPTHVSSSQHYAGDNEETHDEPERSRSILDPQLSTGQLSAPSSSRPRNSGPSGSQPASSTQSPQADQAQTPATEAPGSPGKKLWIKRSHAKRTCLRCQRLKARCVLPDLNVYSSEAPLPAALRCERCVKRGADCVVDDNRGPKPPPPGYQVQGSLASRSVGSAQVAGPVGAGPPIPPTPSTQLSSSARVEPPPRGVGGGGGGGGEVRPYFPRPVTNKEPRREDWVAAATTTRRSGESSSAAATTSRYHPAEHFATAAARSALFPGSDEMGQIWHSSAARAVHWPSTVQSGNGPPDREIFAEQLARRGGGGGSSSGGIGVAAAARADQHQRESDHANVDPPRRIAEQRPHAAGRSQDGRQGGPSLLAPASQVFAVLRPLALFSQMVNGLISKSSVEFETSFGSARCMYVVRAGLTPALLGLIEDRYNTLLGWAPYLPELNILRTSASDPATTNADNRFLLTVASWTTLRGEGGERALVTEARKALKADVVAGTLRALSSVPASLDVARALVLLAIHSTIDFELDRSSTADHIPSRGLIAAARTIVSKLDPPQLLVDLSSAGSRGMPVSRASALTRADRIKDLSHVALCFTIATQESHIALSGFSLRSTALDNLPDVDERMLFELEHEANTVLGNHQAFRFLALTSRVRTFKRLDTCVRGMYLIRLPSDEYGDLKDRVEEMFAEFDLLRSEQEVTFSRFSSSLADKVGTWSLIEIDAIEECICQRFCNYISIGTFHPPAEIDTYKVLQNNMTSTAQRDFTAHVFNRNESTMTRYLSLVSNMGDWLNFVPQTITFALVLRAAKVILEQCTARMIGWGTVASNVETLELLITSAARALVASAGSSAGGELGGGPGAGSLHAKRSADGRRAGNVDRGIGARAEGSEDAESDRRNSSLTIRGTMQAAVEPSRAVSSAGDTSPPPPPIDGDDEAASRSEFSGGNKHADQTPPPSKRTYAFSPRYPCGSAESIPLICAYLLHEIAIALNRRTKLYRLMGAQKRRAEAEARMLAREHALARDASGGRGEDEGRGGSASTTELDGRSSRQSNVTASGGSMVSSWTSANSALGYERGGGTGPGSSSGTSMGQITPGGQQQPLSASLSALPGPGQNQSTDAFASPPSQPDRASSSMSISALAHPQAPAQQQAQQPQNFNNHILPAQHQQQQAPIDLSAFLAMAPTGLEVASSNAIAELGMDLTGMMDGFFSAVDPTFSLQPYGMGGGPAGGGLGGGAATTSAGMGGGYAAGAEAAAAAAGAGQDRTGPEPILSSGLPQQGRSKLMLDTMVPASWIDTVFQANGFTFNPADFS